MAAAEAGDGSTSHVELRRLGLPPRTIINVPETGSAEWLPELPEQLPFFLRHFITEFHSFIHSARQAPPPMAAPGPFQDFPLLAEVPQLQPGIVPTAADIVNAEKLCREILDTDVVARKGKAAPGGGGQQRLSVASNRVPLKSSLRALQSAQPVSQQNTKGMPHSNALPLPLPQVATRASLPRSWP